MKKPTMYLWAMAMIALALMAAACTANGNAVKEITQPIHIGVVGPLTGDAASYGLAAKEGLDFAVKEINSQGGVLGRPLQLHYADSQADPKQAATIMNKFVYVDNYDVVIVADGSGASAAAAPIGEQTQTLMIGTLGSSPVLTDAGDFYFRTIPSDVYQGYELADYANQEGFRKAAVLYANDPYGEGIKEIFAKEFDGNIVMAESFENSDTDFRSQLTKIKAKDPDVLLVVARAELPNILKQMHTLALDTVVLGSETTKNDAYIELAGPYAEEMISIYFAEPADYKNYKDHFIASYGKEPAGYSDYSYDAVYVLAKAMETGKTTNPVLLKNILYGTTIYGATGKISFDSNGDVTDKPFSFFQVQTGKFVEI